MSFIDKIYVINLKKRPNKKESISKRLLLEGLGTPIEFVEAFDLRFVDKKLLNHWLNEQGFIVYKGWNTKNSQLFEGFNFSEWDNRDLSNAEIGCFLSHYFIWQKCASQNETSLILEDDATWKEGALKTFLSKDSKDIPSYDLLYLGRNKVSKKEESVIDSKGDFVKPQFSYNAHSYILTNSACEKILATNPETNLIPVDELLPALWTKHRREDIAQIYAPILNAASVNLDRFQIWQSSDKGSYISDISKTPQEENFKKYLDISCTCFTVSDNTHNEGLEKHIRSASHYGIKINILGLKTPWEGGDMINDPGGGQKINLLIPEIDKLKEDPNSIVLFVDGFDIVFLSNLKSILERFISSGKRIIFGAEKSCWPDRNLSKDYPSSPYEYKYLNSGNFIGYASDIAKILSKAKKDEVTNISDDQLYYTKEFLYGEYKDLISLDYHCEIFQCLAHAYEDIQIHEGLAYNKVTKTRPLVLHGNSGKEKFWDLTNFVSSKWNKEFPHFPVGNNLKNIEIYVSLYFIPEKGFSTESMNKFMLLVKSFTYPKNLIRLHIQIPKEHLDKVTASIDLNEYLDVLFTDTQGFGSSEAKDQAVANFLSTSSQYFFYIENICLINEKDTISKLINLNKDIASPCLKEGERANFQSDSIKKIISREVKGCFAVPFTGACYLVKRKVLEKNKKPYSKEGVDCYIAFVKNLSYNRILFHVDNSVDYGVISWSY